MFIRGSLFGVLFCASLFASIFASLAGCATFNEVIFELRGVSLQADNTPSTDGSLVLREFRIDFTQIRLVLGDIHLQTQEPTQEFQIFTTLPPLLAPGQEVPADQIGHQGRFPGLWAINITPGAQPHIFANGYVEAGRWQDIRIRFAPAVSGIRGLTYEELRQHTILIDANAQKGNLRCALKLRLAFEQGISRRIQFTVENNKKYRNRIQLDYARWFKDVPIDALCTPNQPTLTIDKDNNQTVASQIQNAIPHSITFQFDITN